MGVPTWPPEMLGFRSDVKGETRCTTFLGLVPLLGKEKRVGKHPGRISVQSGSPRKCRRVSRQLLGVLMSHGGLAAGS